MYSVHVCKFPQRVIPNLDLKVMVFFSVLYLEMVQDRALLTMARVLQVVCDLLNGAILSELE